ncbi:SRPBCC domain-containing protein, partial [Rhizobium ruizarguesonis]
KSMGVPIHSCEMDVRTGGRYRITFAHDASDAMAFFGKYLDVTPPSRLDWTNDESEGAAVTTETFEEEDGRTLLVLH